MSDMAHFQNALAPIPFRSAPEPLAAKTAKDRREQEATLSDP